MAARSGSLGFRFDKTLPVLGVRASIYERDLPPYAPDADLVLQDSFDLIVAAANKHWRLVWESLSSHHGLGRKS